MRHTDELLALADLLDSHQDNSHTFDMRHWSISVGCKTICCAIGLGLHHNIFKGGLELRGDYPCYAYYSSFMALVAYFDLDKKTIHYLFNWEEYLICNQPKLVASRIREVVSSSKLNPEIPKL